MFGSFLAVQQAWRVVVASLMAALLVLGVQSFWLATVAERDHQALRERVGLSLESGLAKALWNYDEDTARAIISDGLRSNPIRVIEVRDADGAVFARVEGPTQVADLSLWQDYLGWLVRLEGEQTLDLTFSSTIDNRHHNVTVGQAQILYDKDHFLRMISDRLASQALGILFVVLVVALSTSAVFHWFVSRHIIRVSKDLSTVDPEDPAATILGVPWVHRRNEFGRMIDRLNRLLRQLARVQSELRRLATRDTLTNLPNRGLVLEMLDRAIDDARLEDTRCAVMFLDLDMFKHVNDSLGHGAGDDVLKEVGKRLGAELSGLGAVGRLGGDEFVVMIPEYDREEDLARLARRLIASVKRPVSLLGTLVHPSTCVGIACHPLDGSSAQALLRSADTALYAAKAGGPGQWAFFNRSMTEGALDRLRTEAKLRTAVEAEDLVLHYQPKLDLSTGRITGCEALVRWNSEGKMIPPGRFIPIAEETGLIYDIGLWVLREACQAHRRWMACLGEVTVAVNVSAQQLKEDRFLADFLSILGEFGIDPRHLELEVTESVIMSRIDVSSQLLGEIKAHGVRLSVDDFGTGYSSLAYLKKLPIDILKIDRAFVKDLPQDTSIPRMIISLADQLGLRTVAEGIESQAQLDWLRENGCQMAQGFLIGRPMPEADFVSFVPRYNTRVMPGNT
ncbi:MAG: EAL domain-containing protein [Rhodospirillum sp.]|nr:EAL domain-containing protein [Rhodospirillum sp.]MCF8488233.1 EAL domain-containing protein [Rhodospirillum sp.]MCF8501241.1 EAL domain-containing protein [Rhodospirillum sp.]